VLPRFRAGNDGVAFKSGTDPFQALSAPLAGRANHGKMMSKIPPKIPAKSTPWIFFITRRSAMTVKIRNMRYIFMC
jgi:hypothetical protein